MAGIQRKNKLFGSRRRTEILILLSLLEESYPTELARLLNAGLFSVQGIVEALEEEGVVATRNLGRTRRVALNPRFLGYRDLKNLLRKLSEGEPELRNVAARRRSRPRRKGKEI